MLYYITIGNSDDKLSQQRWAEFCREVDKVLKGSEFTRHFHGYSLPNAPWQNAIWAVEMDESDQVNVDRIKELLRWVADRLKQDSIAWTPAPMTELLIPERKLDK
jgi:hypothetical protein